MHLNPVCDSDEGNVAIHSLIFAVKAVFPLISPSLSTCLETVRVGVLGLETPREFVQRSLRGPIAGSEYESSLFT